MRLAAPLALAVALALLAAVPAPAEFEPIRLVSKSDAEQADVATAPALSADGRYVAFRATIGGRVGVFRKDLETGDLLQVATLDAYAPGSAQRAPDAPSISADGRYVSFTTRVSLDPTNDDVPAAADDADVYVADLASSPPIYELASALHHDVAGLSYAGPVFPAVGAYASGGVALSADGRRVVFVIRGESNLGGSPQDPPDTPTRQVVLRDLDLNETTLVSAERDVTGGMGDDPVPGGAASELDAALSADGTTVAWPGVNLPAQVPMLADELAAAMKAKGDGYNEPLWRRVADGSGAPTRRIVGGGDPLAPGCPRDGTLDDPACQGPFPFISRYESILKCGDKKGIGWIRMGLASPQIRLSADGRTVALIGSPDGYANVFAVDMREGLSRREALRQLTSAVPIEEACRANERENVPNTGDVFDLGLSADGERIAFATGRQQFPLAPPNLLSPDLARLGLAELYRIDLGAETLERVTPGPGGTPSLGPGGSGGGGSVGVSSPSFAADGRTLAFASLAANIAGGDANAASDVFVASDRVFADEPGTVDITSPPPPPTAKPRWRIRVAARANRRGVIRIFAAVPGPGVLRVAARESRPRGEGRRPRWIAARRRRAGDARVVSVGLRPRRRLLRLARSRLGLPATVRVAFRGPGRKVLRDSLDVAFRVRPSARALRRIRRRRARLRQLRKARRLRARAVARR